MNHYLKFAALTTVLFSSALATAQQTINSSTFDIPPFVAGDPFDQFGWDSTTTTGSVSTSMGSVAPHNGSGLLATQTRTLTNTGRWWWVLSGGAYTSASVPNKMVVGTVYIYTGTGSQFQGSIGIQAYNFAADTIIGQIFYDESENSVFAGNETTGVGLNLGTFGSSGAFDPRGAWRRLDLGLDFENDVVRAFYDGVPMELATTSGAPLTDNTTDFSDFDPFTFSFADQAAKNVAFDTYRVRVYNKAEQVISGRVNLSDFGGSTAGIPISVRLESITNLGSTAGTYTTTADSQGFFEVKTPLSGTYNIYVKASHWLQQEMGEYDFGATTSNPTRISPFTALADSTLINGDVDGDNEVSILDYIDLSSAYGTVTGDSGFNANADLDGDGEVSILDYITLSTNYGIAGEGPL